MSHTLFSRIDRSTLRAGGAIAGVLALSLLAGCAQRHHIAVGSVPDDYRTNHPIMISDKEHNLDLPVGRSDRGMTRTQKIALGGFLDRYDTSAAPVVSVLVPSGSANEYAAQSAVDGIIHTLRANGVPDHRITTLAYSGHSPEASPPIRVTYTGVTAHVAKCGRWPADLADTTDNKHYANFGCASQNNLAAQIADPADLLGPRKPTTIDAERREVSIQDYRARESVFDPSIDY